MPDRNLASPDNRGSVNEAQELATEWLAYVREFVDEGEPLIDDLFDDDCDDYFKQLREAYILLCARVARIILDGIEPAEADGAEAAA